MAPQALYRRWRPQTFEDVLGQPHVTTTLRNALDTGRLAHAYLFAGPRGTGKTSVARILARAVNCEGPAPRPCNTCSPCIAVLEGRLMDLLEIDAASNTGVDDVRDLREKIAFSPSEGRYKVYIIDEVHMLSTAAFNALLKTLEEPPEHVIFVLATTEAHKLPETILSRCQRHDFRRFSVADVIGKLRRICQEDGIEADDSALEIVARSATGSMRDAESLLDLLIAGGDTVTAERVRATLGTASSEAVTGVVDALASLDAASALTWINRALDAGADPRQLQAQLLDRLRNLLLIQTGIDATLLNATQEEREGLRAQAAALPPRLLTAALGRVNDAEPSADRSHPGLPIELAVVELIVNARDEKAGGATVAVRPPALVAESTTQPAEKSQAPAATAPEPQRDTTDKPRDSKVEQPAGTAPEKHHDATAKPRGSKAEQPAGTAPQREATPQGVSAIDPAPPVTESPAARPTVAGAAGGLAALEAQWLQLIAAVETRDRSLAALLKDCRPEEVDDARVTLGFFYEFHARRASEPARVAVLRQALAELTGQDRDVRSIQVNATANERSTRPTNRSDQAATDPLIRHAVQELGARVSSVSVPEEDRS